jgi:hypothetical protein
MLASKTLVSGGRIAELKLIGYAESFTATNPAIPSNVLPGDLLIGFCLDHEDGDATTPGNTNNASFTGFTLIVTARDNNGNDDIDINLSYKIAVAGDAGTVLVGGTSGGDSFFNSVYVFRANRYQVSSVAILNSYGECENSQTSLVGNIGRTFTTNFIDSRQSNQIQLLLAMFASGLAGLGKRYISTMNAQPSLNNINLLAYKAYDGLSYGVDSSVTFGVTKTSQYWGLAIGSLSLSLV